MFFMLRFFISVSIQVLAPFRDEQVHSQPASHARGYTIKLFEPRSYIQHPVASKWNSAFRVHPPSRVMAWSRWDEVAMAIQAVL